MLEPYFTIFLHKNYVFATDKRAYRGVFSTTTILCFHNTLFSGYIHSDKLID